MISRDSAKAAFQEFLLNPQAHGVWSLRVQFAPEGFPSVLKLLNLSDHGYYPRYYRSVWDDNHPPEFLLRLIAYLRACGPAADAGDLPDLFTGRPPAREPRAKYSRRFPAPLVEWATTPKNLGQEKKRTLSKASAHFFQHFSRCRASPVPGNAWKLDFVDRQRCYFQVLEEARGTIRAYSPDEGCLQALRELFSRLAEPLDCKLESELTKAFSPEDALLQMYVPALRFLGIGDLVRDRRIILNVSQALEEIDDERFVHAVRSVGVAAEEVCVEIYETYVREKSPEAPLGALLSQLAARSKEITNGRAQRTAPDLGATKRALGEVIRSLPPGETAVRTIIEQLQKSVIPLLQTFSDIAEAQLRERQEKAFGLFPPFVDRCIEQLVALRNRASHRVERHGPVSHVGYSEAASAIRSLCVVAAWWQEERASIDYKSDRKAAIEQTAARSRAGAAGRP